MKKLAAVLLIACAAGFAVWYTLQPSQPLRPSLQPSDLLPADTLLTLEMVDLEKKIEEFKSCRLGRNLATIDFSAVLQQLDTPPEVLDRFEKTKTTILSNMDSNLFKELFGQETTLAILPFEDHHLRPDKPQQALNMIVIISRPRHNTELIEFAAQLLKEKLNYQTEDYNGYTIKRFVTENDFPVCYTTVDGLMVTATDSRLIKRCLDLASSAKPSSLSANGDYVNLRNQLHSLETVMFTYNNTSESVENILSLLQQRATASEQQAVIESYSAAFKGLNAIGAAFYDDGSQLLTNKVLVMFDKVKMDPLYRKTYSIQPAINHTLPMVPQDLLAYYWTNILEPQAYFNNQLIDNRTRQELKAELKANFDIDLDDLLTAFGNQFGFILSDIGIGGMVPIPKLTLLVEVKNKEMVAKLFNAIILDSNLNMMEEDFEGTSINHIVLPLGADVQPAYAFFHDFCILSSSPELIKQMIRTHQNGGRITDSEAFQNVNQGLTDKNNTVVFVKNDRLIDAIQGLIGWGSNMLALKNRDFAAKSRIAVEQVIHPILDGMKMYKTIGARSVFNENTIENVTVFHVERD